MSKIGGIGIGRATEIVLSTLAVANIVALAGFALLAGGEIVRLAWVAFGMLALLGVAIDSEGRSAHWGLVTWVSVAALLALAILQGLGAVLYGLPALLADRRRGRSGPASRAFAGLLGLANLAILAYVVTVALT